MTEGDVRDSLAWHRLLSGEELQACRHPAEARLTGISLSEVALAVSLRVDAAQAPGPTQDFRDQLPVVMRSLQDRLRRYGVDCPAIAVLYPNYASASGFRKAYGELSADQDWHRGEFLVFVEEASAKADERLIDLLDPAPPGRDIAASAPTLQHIVDFCSRDLEDGSLLSTLVRAWQDEIKGEREEETTQGEADRGVRGIRNHLAPLQDETTQLLRELD